MILLSRTRSLAPAALFAGGQGHHLAARLLHHDGGGVELLRLCRSAQPVHCRVAGREDPIHFLLPHHPGPLPMVLLADHLCPDMLCPSAMDTHKVEDTFTL